MQSKTGAAADVVHAVVQCYPSICAIVTVCQAPEQSGSQKGLPSATIVVPADTTHLAVGDNNCQMLDHPMCIALIYCEWFMRCSPSSYVTGDPSEKYARQDLLGRSAGLHLQHLLDDLLLLDQKSTDDPTMQQCHVSTVEAS